MPPDRKTGPREDGDPLGKHLPTIVSRLPQALKAGSQKPRVRENQGAYLARLPRILECLLRTPESGEELRPKALALGAEHGMKRRKQGYGVSVIISDIGLLHTQIFDLVESRLLNRDATSLICDSFLSHS